MNFFGVFKGAFGSDNSDNEKKGQTIVGFMSERRFRELAPQIESFLNDINGEKPIPWDVVEEMLSVLYNRTVKTTASNELSQALTTIGRALQESGASTWAIGLLIGMMKDSFDVFAGDVELMEKYKFATPGFKELRKKYQQQGDVISLKLLSQISFGFHEKKGYLELIRGKKLYAMTSINSGSPGYKSDRDELIESLPGITSYEKLLVLRDIIGLEDDQAILCYNGRKIQINSLHATPFLITFPVRNR